MVPLARPGLPDAGDAGHDGEDDGDEEDTEDGENDPRRLDGGISAAERDDEAKHDRDHAADTEDAG